MLEPTITQAMGLMGLAPPTGARLLPVVSHGDESAELPLLWRLCATLVELGYAVTVLDGTTPEAARNPGLAQLLDDVHGLDAPGSFDPAWQIIPSAQGIQNLDAGAPGLANLAELFPQDGIVVLYCHADAMVRLLAQSGATPLLAISSSKTALLTSYLALKRLLLNGHLEPTVISLNEAGKGTVAHETALALRDCAARFLALELNPLQLAAARDDEAPSLALRHLALRLLENAVYLHSAAAAMPALSSWRPSLGTTPYAGVS